VIVDNLKGLLPVAELNAGLSASLASPSFELFDLEMDPNERRNLSTSYSQPADVFSEHFAALLAAVSPLLQTRPVGDLSPEDAAALEALGYVGDD
jgi:hypothetical protein